MEVLQLTFCKNEIFFKQLSLQIFNSWNIHGAQQNMLEFTILPACLLSLCVRQVVSTLLVCMLPPLTLGINVLQVRLFKCFLCTDLPQPPL